MKKILLTLAALAMTSSFAMGQSGISSRYQYGDAPPANGRENSIDFSGTSSIDRPVEYDQNATPRDPVLRDPADISNESPD